MSRVIAVFIAICGGLCLLIVLSPSPPLLASDIVQQARIETTEHEAAVTALAYGRLLPAATEQQDIGMLAAAQPSDPAAFIRLDNSHQPDALPGSGSLTFSSDRGGDFDLYARQFPQPNATLLLDNSSDLATPTWSPDGRFLLYASNEDGDFDIYLRGPDETPVKLTANAAEDIHPSWSPDGRRILFASNRQGNFQIFSMDRSGGDIRQHGYIAGNNAMFPRYSPDGERIAFMRASIIVPACDWNWDIWIMDDNGGNQRRITSQLGGDLYPNWSVDGQTILYARCEYLLTSDLYAINPDTGAETQMTDSFLSNEWNAVYAASGGYLAFNSDLSGNSDIYVAAGSGGSAANVTATAGEDLAPAWSGPVPDVCADASATVQPLLLAPGWGAADLISDDTSGFAPMLPYLEGIGYRLGCNLFYAGDTDAAITIHQNGRRIMDNLCTAYGNVLAWNPAWNGRFDIIGHSYGGLRARAFLESADMYDPLGLEGAHCQTPELTAGRMLFVDNLYTLGSPHGGGFPDLPGALAIAIPHFLNPDEQGSVFQLLDMPDFNWAHSQPDDVCYWLVGGNAWAQPRTHLLLGDFYFDYQKDLLPNDLGVYQFSAHDLYNNYDDQYPLVVPAPTEDMHGYFWLLATIQSYVYPNHTFNEWLKPHLENPDTNLDDCLAAIQAAESRVTVPDRTATIALAPAIQLAAGEIISGFTTNGQFVLDEGGKTTIFLNWPDGDLILHLASPNGTLFTPDTVTSMPDVSYQAAAVMGHMAGYVITNTLSGTWTYTLTAESVPFAMPYQLTAMPEYPAAVMADVTAYVSVGETAIITGAVGSGTMPLPDATAVAYIGRPDGVIETLPLWDDGAHYDGVAGDAIFGSAYLPTNGPGRYTVTVQAAGSDQGQDYTRTGTAVLTVHPPGASLADQYSDTPRDENGDGRFEWLDVQTSLEVTNTGVYRLSGELVSHTGQLLAIAATEASLVPGQQNVNLPFPAAHLVAGGVDGPYHLTNLRLLDVTAGTWTLATASNVYETAPYNLEAFRPWQFNFLPFVTSS